MSRSPGDELTTRWPAVPQSPPAQMRAVVFDGYGAPEVLHTTSIDTPAAGRGEILVRVAAVSVGRLLDLTLRAGRHPAAAPPLPHVLGAEHAGTVAALGPGVSSVAVGDHVAVLPSVTCGNCAFCVEGRTEACAELRIIGVHRRGAYAEYTAVPAVNAHVLPADLDPTTAAGLALAGPVAANQLQQARFRPGDWVLVQGAASALGSLTAAFAAHLGGSVIGTSRSAWKRRQLLELGLAAVLDPLSPTFVADVLALTGGAGVAVAIDDLGEPQLWDQTMEVLATGGTVVSSGAFLGGRVTIDLRRIYLRNQRIIGVRTGNAGSAAALWAEVERGFRPVVDRIFPIARAADAHRHLEAADNMGRVVLSTATSEDWT